MNEDVMRPRGRVCGAVDGEDVSDAEKGDDDQQGLRGLPVLVVVLLGCGRRGAQLRDHHLRNIV